MPFLVWLYFTEKTIIAKLLDYKLSNDEKEEVWKWTKALLNQVKSYINNNLNPAKVIDLIKHSFTRLLSIQEMLDELEIAKVDYYRALSISKMKIKSYIQKCWCWSESLAGKYGHTTCFQWVLGSDTYVSIFLENWRSVFTSHKAVTQGRFWEQHTSSWHHEASSYIIMTPLIHDTMNHYHTSSWHHDASSWHHHTSS